LRDCATLINGLAGAILHDHGSRSRHLSRWRRPTRDCRCPARAPTR
jgi:hypothetical protein